MTKPRTRRALFLTTSFPADAADYAGRFVAHAAHDLAERRWEVRVLAPSGTWRPPGVALSTYSMPTPLRGGSGIPEALERAPVKAHLAGLAATSALWRAARRIRTPGALLVPHWLLPGALVATHLNREGKGPRAPVHCVAHGGDVALLERLPGGRALARRVDARVSAITFVSEDLRRRFEALLGRAPRSRAPVIPMGIRPAPIDQPFATALRRQLRGRSAVGTVGRLTPIKGLDDLAHALAGREDVLWFCAGDGPEQGPLTDLCRRLGVRRVPLGRVTPAQRDALLSVIDAFVLPSRPRGGRTEGTPVSLLEALAAGAPCVVTETGGVGSVARAADAILVPPGQPAVLGAALGALLRDPERREAMAAAHRTAGSVYLWDAIGARHAAAFAASLDGGHPPARS